jgi:hypothetical protein
MKGRRAGGPVVLLAWLVGSGAVASCNLVVGVGDYSVGDAEADGTTLGDVGAGSDVGHDQTTDRGGDQTNGGDGPTDGGPTDANGGGADVPGEALADSGLEGGGDGGSNRDAADGGDASRDAGSGDAEGGSLDAAVTCGQGIPTGQAFNSLVTSCVLAASCDIFPFAYRISDCLSRNALKASAYYSCLSTITSCAGATNSYYSCTGLRPAPECAGTFTSSCTGNVAFDCSHANAPFIAIATNCNTRGGTCATYTDSTGASRADCVVVPSCTVTDGGTQCSGNSAYTCLSNNGGTAGTGFGRNCGANAMCTTPTGGGTGCYVKGASTCTDGGGTATCSASGTARACTTLGQVFDFDCTAAGGSCVTEGGVTDCVGPGCTLSSPCAESCNGTTNVMTVCVGGAPYPIDCTQYSQYGFTGCAINSAGAAICL